MVTLIFSTSAIIAYFNPISKDSLALCSILIMIVVNGPSHVLLMPVGPWSSMAFVAVRSKCPLVYIMATAQRFRLTPRAGGTFDVVPLP